MENIHSRIKDLRERKKLSMESLGKLIGVSWQTIQQWEKQGGTAPKRTRLDKVAEALGTTSEYLVAGHQVKYAEQKHVLMLEQQRAEYRHPDKTIAEVIAILEQTDEKGRIMALGAIRSALNGYSPNKQSQAR